MAKAKTCSRLKLLIDMKKDRVLFAEAGKDFVDNMCMILRSGCVHHLCKGVGLVSKFSILESEAAETYIITDDLVFTPMSTHMLLKIFQKFEISDMDSLSEIIVTVSDSQMNKLAIVSLRSKTVLTDVLLPSQARQTKRKEESSIQKQDGDNEEDKQKEDTIVSAMGVKPSKRTKVIGRDSHGCVQGLGQGVSRINLTVSAPYRDSLAASQATHASLTSKVEDLSHLSENICEEIDRMFAMLEHSKRCMPPPTDIGGSSQAAPSAPPPAQLKQGTACRLMHLQRGSTCVAEGRVLGVSSQDEALLSIIIDEIFVHDCILVDRHGTFADIEIGVTITWPRFRTVLV